jgi:hypothetical protein
MSQNALDPKQLFEEITSSLDRAKIQSGVIKYETVNKPGGRERWMAILKGEKYLVQSFNEPSLEWFDGKSRVIGDLVKTNKLQAGQWVFTIWGKDQIVRIPAVTSLEIFWRRQPAEPFLSIWQPLEASKDKDLVKVSMLNLKTRWKETYVARRFSQHGSSDLLPIAVSYETSKGERVASWDYGGWTNYEGNIWFPETCVYRKNLSVISKAAEDKETTYHVSEARFNLSISECWFWPQFPPKCTIVDNFSAPHHQLVYPSFTGGMEFIDPFVGTIEGDERH